MNFDSPSARFAAMRGFFVAAVLTIALGIGANTAMFSVVNGLLCRPLAFHGSERLVWIADPGSGWTVLLNFTGIDILGLTEVVSRSFDWGGSVAQLSKLRGSKANVGP